MTRKTTRTVRSGKNYETAKESSSARLETIRRKEVRKHKRVSN